MLSCTPRVCITSSIPTSLGVATVLLGELAAFFATQNAGPRPSQLSRTLTSILPNIRTRCCHAQHVFASHQAFQLHWESLLFCWESWLHFSPHKTQVRDPANSPGH